MGTRKELLRLPDGKAMYVHLLHMLQEVFPDADALYMSIKSRDRLRDLLSTEYIVRTGDRAAVLTSGQRTKIEFLFDSDASSSATHCGSEDIGPAAGLLAAYCAHPTANWLVTACDFPLLEALALRQLLEEFDTPLTCYLNSEGFVEPLLAIWSPEALQQLQGNVVKGQYGPRFVAEQVKAKTILPAQNRWLFNANTVEEWREALTFLEPSSIEQRSKE